MEDEGTKTVEPDKSPFDLKQYRAITLDNGIRALLICDNRTVSSQGTHKRKRTESEDSEPEKEGEESSSEESEGSDSEGEDGVEEVDGVRCEGVGGGVERERSADNVKSQRVRSACGVCIRTGSYCDPPEVPGLAHLLEHMVFMGSKKYPGENTFDAYTNKHGGFDNASTDYERTVFQFCVHPQYFKEGLDMFAHFFASPSLLKQSLDREIEAVDNEFQTAVQNDRDRTERLMASLAKPGHPFTNFVWGNSESLKRLPKKNGVDLAKALRDYYKRHYSSHYMTVVVMSCYPLDTLEQWTREAFSAVPHNGLPLPLMADKKDVFDESTFAKLYRVVPVKETHKLKVTWILPSLMDKYKSKPIEYVCWLLGHEGEGSVYDELKKRHLATSLLAGNGGSGYEYNSAFSLLSCDITLTDKGFEEVFHCLTLVFQYLNMLVEVGPQERVFREIQEVNKNEFNFKEEEEPIDFVEAICERMETYPVEHYLNGDHLLFEYDPATITSVLSYLTPDTANIMIISQSHTKQCKRKERWFGTQYCVEDVPEEWRTKWQNLGPHPDLHLPKPNLFIATDFSERQCESPATEHPVVIEESSKFKLWYKKGTGAKHCPKAWVCLLFQSPLYYQCPENAVLMNLFLDLYGRNVTEVAYSASVAQLDYEVDVSCTGVTLVINGFNHKMNLLFQELINHFGSFVTTEESFTTAKEQQRKSLSNQILKPKKLCKMSRLKVLEYHHWTAQEKLSVLDHLTMPSLMEFTKMFRHRLFVEALIQGNTTAQEARTMMAYLTEHIHYEPMPKDVQAKIQPRSVQLPSNAQVCYRLDNNNTESTCTVITDYYQCCQRTVRDTAIVELLTLCMDEPCFNELRTKQQLGYEVYMKDHNTHSVVGLSLTLVTHATKFSDDYASEKMKQFVHDFHCELTKWTPKQFQDQVDSLIQEKKEPDLSLEEEVLRNWGEVMLATYNFDQLKQAVAELETVTQAEACDWLHRYTHSGEHYRKLSVKVVSQHPQKANLSEDEVARSQSATPTSTQPTICKECSGRQLNLDPGESSVDPPLSPQPTTVTVDSEGVEGLKAGLFVYPSLWRSSHHT